MYGNYYYSPYVLNFGLGLPLFNQYPCPIPQTQNLQCSLVNYRQQPQSCSTERKMVQEESNLIKKEEDLPIIIRNQSECQQLKGKRHNKSIFHNYQKHLVATLKQKITSKQIREYDSKDECLRQLWHGFNQSKVANRTLLLAVFGEGESNQGQVVSCMQICHFSNILSRFTFQQIKAAQHKTRQIVKLYFKDKSLDQELVGRKLSVQEIPIFKHYINYFISELSEGNLNKRLPKRYKQQMML